MRRILRRLGVADGQASPGRPVASEPEEPAIPAPFFHVSPTCQIPFLSFLYEEVFGRRRDGVFVEIGAYDGYSYSNTSCLADAGWAGFYVEAVPEYAERCRERYQDRPLINVTNVAIGPSAGELTVQLGEYLSTPSKGQFDEYKDTSWASELFASADTVTVPMVSLDRFLEGNAVPVGFDLLVVDVEGFEVEVFDGFDLGRWRPLALIVELKDTDPESLVNRASHLALSRRIGALGYEIIFKDRTNTFFVRRDHRPEA